MSTMVIMLEVSYPKKTLTKISDISFRDNLSRASIVKVVRNPAELIGIRSDDRSARTIRTHVQDHNHR